MEEIRIGFIGAWGWRGELGKYAIEEGAKIIGASDIFDESLEKFSEFYKKEGDLYLTKDYKKLLQLAEINTIFVLSPDYLHEEHAIAALKAGKNVYLEKPLGITLEQCDNILRVAMEERKKLFLGHNMRYYPVIQKMKELIDSGIIGEIQAVWCRHFVSYGGEAFFKDWHSKRENTNSLLLQKAAHDIDVIHWLSNSYTKKVVGMGKLSVYDKCKKSERESEGYYKVTYDTNNFPPTSSNDYSKKIDIEDHSMLMMELENNIQVSYTQCHYTPDTGRNYTFIGTKGRLENIGDTKDCKINTYLMRSDKLGVPDRVDYIKKIEGFHSGSDELIIKDFMDYLKYNKKPMVSAVDAREAVAAGILGTESLRGENNLKMVPKLSQEIINYFERI